MGYIDWVNHKQKENKLYTKHLSSELQDKLLNMSVNYIEMHEYLIATHGGMA